MTIDIITLFPDMFVGPFDQSIVRRAIDKDIVAINIHNLRDWATDKHKTVDDKPYGGGKGMILKVNIIDRAIIDLKFQFANSKFQTNSQPKAGPPCAEKTKTILLTPQGKTFNQQVAQTLSKLDHLIFICGHYEGFDQRVRQLVDMELSIGNYVLTGGELPAMVITDTVVRLLPGVLDLKATKHESFSDGNTLDFPQYTRPAEYKGMKVPAVLLSGHYQKIQTWRKKQQKKCQTSK